MKKMIDAEEIVKEMIDVDEMMVDDVKVMIDVMMMIDECSIHLVFLLFLHLFFSDL